MIDYFFEYTLCLGLFYGFYQLCLKDDSFLQRNRYYLLLTSLLALFLPLFEFQLHSAAIGQASPLNLEGITLQVDALKSSFVPQQMAFLQWLSTFYLLGILFFSARLLLHFRKLRQIIRNSAVIHQPGYLQINTEGKLPTFSFFNYLFWDNTQDLSEKEKQKILLHELKHIHDRHSYDIMYFELLKVIFWFNPFLYLYQRALRNNHEYIADASVMYHSDLESYQKLMVQRLFQQLKLNIAHNFNQSEIKARLKRLQSRPTPSYWQIKLIFFLPLILLVFVAFSGKTIPQERNELPFIAQNRFATVAEGLDTFYTELSKNMQYPVEARQAGIEGRVFVQFTVMPNGALTNFKVLKGIHPLCDKEAIRAIQATAVAWLPARVEGKNVKQEVSIPIVFKLN